MQILQKLRERARAQKQHIVLFEGEEDRTLLAAEMIEQEKVARLTLLGNVEPIKSRLRTLGVRLENAALVDPATSDKLEGSGSDAAPAA